MRDAPGCAGVRRCCCRLHCACVRGCCICCICCCVPRCWFLCWLTAHSQPCHGCLGVRDMCCIRLRRLLLLRGGRVRSVRHGRCRPFKCGGLWLSSVGSCLCSLWDGVLSALPQVGWCLVLALGAAFFCTSLHAHANDARVTAQLPCAQHRAASRWPLRCLAAKLTHSSQLNVRHHATATGAATARRHTSAACCDMNESKSNAAAAYSPDSERYTSGRRASGRPHVWLDQSSPCESR